MEQHKGVNILLVEDNPDHAELTLRALEGSAPVSKIYWVKDGEEALEFVSQGRDADGARAPRPGLILLDIKLPKLSGLEVLRRIKADERLKTIPVVMLTTSDRDVEVMECYRAGANSFVTKPVKFAEFVRKIESVKLYWTMINDPA